MYPAGLALALFGGCPKFASTGGGSAKTNNKLPIRGDPHILIVGMVVGTS
jgi:hypothetical protein